MRLPTLAMGLTVLAALTAIPARAALGGRSVEADAAALAGTLQRETQPLYDVARIAAADGTRICEYLDRDGTVFAVSWSGPVAPDLELLLGAQYPRYAAALAALEHPGLQRSVRVALPGLRVDAGGHLRAYSGRAYLPALVPAGVSAAALP